MISACSAVSGSSRPGTDSDATPGMIPQSIVGKAAQSWESERTR